MKPWNERCAEFGIGAATGPEVTQDACAQGFLPNDSLRSCTSYRVDVAASFWHQELMPSGPPSCVPNTWPQRDTP